MGTYYIGGTLPLNSKSYVTRAADEELYQQVRKGEFCYVLNSRQMGKSSLRVRTMHRLQEDGVVCAAIDITELGSQQVTPEKWYGGLIKSLVHKLGLEDKFSLRDWFKERRDIPAVQFFGEFLEEVIFRQISEPVVIFIDEIDSVLQLGFKDDFFALIRSCYNKRADNEAYQRLSFVLLGVATPGDLIEDKTRTPFNIGRAVELQGFQFHEVKPLVEGLQGRVNTPENVIQEVLYWTGGQPFLTQKICQWLWELGSDISVSREKQWIENLVRTRIIENWEASDDPEHLKTIRDRILSNEQRAAYLLDLYQQIRQHGEVVSNNSFEEGKLQLSGLAIKQRQGNAVILKVANPIYFEVFDNTWIEEQLSALRPYAEAFRAWQVSEQKDESRLLRGNALQDAKLWAAGKNLSYLDQQFLAASEKKEIEEQIAQEKLEAELEWERKDSEAAEQRNRVLTQANRKAKQRIRIGAVVMLMAILGATVSVKVARYRVINAQIERQKVERQVQNVSLLSELAGELHQAGNPDDAEQALKQAGLSFEIKDYDLKQAMLLSHISVAYQKLGQFDRAREAVLKSLDLLDKIESKFDLNHSILLAQALNIKSSIPATEKDDGIDFSVNQQAFDILQNLDPDLMQINPALEVTFPHIVEDIYQGVLESIFDSDKISQANLEKARQVMESIQMMKLHQFSKIFPLNHDLVKIDEIDPQAAVFYFIPIKNNIEVIFQLPNRLLGKYSIRLHGYKSAEQSTGEVDIHQLIKVAKHRINFRSLKKSKENFVLNQINKAFMGDIDKIIIQNKIKTLVFVSSNVIDSFPMSALYDGEKYLPEKYAVAVVPALQNLPREKPVQQPRQALVAGTSVFPYEYDISSLPNVKREVEFVSSIMPSITLLDDDFTSVKLQENLYSYSYSVVHIASHFPEGYFIGAFDKQINFQNLIHPLRKNKLKFIDLLVLSGCNTIENNNELIFGLGTLPLRYGTSSVLGSISKPEDRMMANFMIEFYQEWTQSDISKAEALRRAQVSFINDPELSAPYNWASYVLIGDWR